MTTAIEPRNQPLIREQIQALREWRMALILQGMLDYIRKPYCCSGVAASAIAADKALCKLTMAGLGVLTPRWRLPDEPGPDLASPRGAVMVKPRMGGSSVGMALVQHGGNLDEAVKHAAATDAMTPLIEAFVPGLAMTIGLLELPAGVLVLPPLATRPLSSDYYDAEAKLDAHSEHLVAYGEADLPAQITEQTPAQCSEDMERHRLRRNGPDRLHHHRCRGVRPRGQYRSGAVLRVELHLGS